MELTHINEAGKIQMVDVSGKAIVKRSAVAQATIRLQSETIVLLRQGLLKKGDALACARLAAIMAAKRTSELIPLCHQLSLELVTVDFEVGDDRIVIRTSAQCTGKTGAEMEALTSASVAALTVYDMCKAIDKEMIIGDIRLLGKKKEALA